MTDLQAPALIPPVIPAHLLPRHVAIQPDGAGRWAALRGLPRSKGHEAGEAPILDVITGAVEIGIPYLSIHLLTRENWKRPPAEVDFLLNLLSGFLEKTRDQLQEMGVRVRWMGEPTTAGRHVVPVSVTGVLTETEELTRDNETLSLQFCLNYGGRGSRLRRGVNGGTGVGS